MSKAGRTATASLVSALWLGGALLALGCGAPVALAQTSTGGTIRVESKEVLVPVLVLDQQKVTGVEKMGDSAFRRQYDDHYMYLDRLPVTGLSVKDFAVLQDGEQQRIISVVPEAQKQVPILTDNVSKYREFVGVGGGTWAVPLWEYFRPGSKIIETRSLPGYVIGFTPPPSPEGSCHKLQIVVDRPNSLVLSRNEYCHTAGAGADPLHDTALGKRIESDLRKDKHNQLPLNVAATPVFANDGTVRVRVVLDYAPGVNPLMAGCKSTPAVVGFIGIFRDENGREILRFSDKTTRGYDHSLYVMILSKLSGFHGYICKFYAPFRYEAEIQIHSGQYHLQIGFMDGKTFGRADVPVTVPSYTGKQLGISGIVLARRFRDPRLQPPELPIAGTPEPLREIPTEPAKSATTLPENYLPLTTKGVEVTPTANVRFKGKGRLYFFVQVYEPRVSGTPQLSVTLNLRIVNDKTQKIVRQLQPVNAAPFESPGNPVVPIGGGILIANLKKGSYKLQAQATDSVGASTDWRSVAFTIY